MARTTDWSESEVLDEVLGNGTVNGIEDSVRVKVGNFALQLAANGLAASSTVSAISAALAAELIARADGDTSLTALIDAILAQKGVAGGIATLDGGGRVPIGQLPESVTTGLTPLGEWNANTNTPTIPAASGDNLGHFYIVTTAGTTNIDGTAVWDVGDWIVSNGAAWFKLPASPLSAALAAIIAEVEAAREPAVGDPYDSLPERLDAADATVAALAEDVDRIGIESFELPYLGYDDEPAVIHVDQDDGVFQRITASGVGVAPGATADETAIYRTEDGVMFVTDASGDRIFHDPAPLQYSGPVQKYQGHPMAVSNLATVGNATVMLVKGAAKLIMPAARKLLFVIFCVGQSNAAGATATSIPAGLATQDYPAEALMMIGDPGDPAFDVRMRLNVGEGGPEALNPSTLKNFGGLISRTGFGGSVTSGVTPLEGTAKRIMHDTTEAFGVRPRMLFINVGVSGKNYNSLKKGQVPHNNLVASAGRAIEIGRAKGYEVHFLGIVHVHGEADGAKATYDADLLEWQPDIQNDIYAKQVELQGYAQAGPIPFLMSQPSSFSNGSKLSVAAMRNVQTSSPLHRISTAGYPYPMPDLLHYDGVGQFLHGEKIGQAAMQYFFGGAYLPLCPVPGGVIWTGGTELRVPIQGNDGPLVLDDETIDDPNGKYGFRCRDSTGSLGIDSVDVDNTQTPHPHVVIDLETVPNGSGCEVDYAWSGYSIVEGNRVPGTGPRGCLRDSSSTPSLHDGRPLYNHSIHWLEQFEEAA